VVSDIHNVAHLLFGVVKRSPRLTAQSIVTEYDMVIIIRCFTERCHYDNYHNTKKCRYDDVNIGSTFTLQNVTMNLFSAVKL